MRIQKKQELNDGDDDNDDYDGIEESVVVTVSAAAGLCQSSERKRKNQSKYPDKSWWSSGYQTLDDGEFIKRLWVSQRTLEYISTYIRHGTTH